MKFLTRIFNFNKSLTTTNSMEKSKKAVGPSLTKHVEIDGKETIVKFHMEDTTIKVESIDGDAKADPKDLFDENELQLFEKELEVMAQEYPDRAEWPLIKDDQEEHAVTDPAADHNEKGKPE